jgi:hypothetical protein
MQEWLAAQIGKEYDVSAMFRAWWDREGEGPGDASYEPENYDKLMCIEVVLGALKEVKLIPGSVNPAEMLAPGVVRLLSRVNLIRADTYYQLLGTPQELSFATPA